MKRCFDVLVSAASLLLLSPLMLLLAAFVQATLGSPVLFRQTRPGLRGKPFNLVKFRTMSEARDAAGNLLPDAERLTRLGRFLRSTSLDEFPEFWNVLKGEMSLVGPRPLLMEYLNLYSKRQRRRHEVKPGITGWAQINGRNAVDWPERLEMDVWYVENQSFWLDLKILFLTVWIVVRRDGINALGHSTQVKFKGETE